MTAGKHLRPIPVLQKELLDFSCANPSWLHSFFPPSRDALLQCYFLPQCLRINHTTRSVNLDSYEHVNEPLSICPFAQPAHHPSHGIPSRDIPFFSAPSFYPKVWERRIHHQYHQVFWYPKVRRELVINPIQLRHGHLLNQA